jgi:general secretion pathway protein J
VEFAFGLDAATDAEEGGFMKPQFVSHDVSRDGGFTLLELLVAMTLLGLLSVVLYGALTFGVRTWERSETLTAATNGVRQVQSLLATELSRAYPELIASDPDHQRIAFDGRPHELTYLARDPFHPGALDRIDVGLSQAHGTLLRRASLELSAGDRGATTALLRGVSTFDVSYFGPARKDSPPEWQAAWQNRMTLPVLIRIHATFSQKGMPPWPDLIVAPRISADVSCDFDPLTNDCQGR